MYSTLLSIGHESTYRHTSSGQVPTHGHIGTRSDDNDSRISQGRTMKKPPVYAFALPLMLGFVAAATPANFPFADQFLVSLLASTGVFALAGAICGGIWPPLGWRWGLWVAAPGFLLVTLGVITSGEWARFLTDDLPFITTGLLGASVGSAGASRLRSVERENDAESAAP